MKRTPSRELLDSDEGTAEEIAGSLADLRMINRWFGGQSTTRDLLRRVIERTGQRTLAMLEVAAGSADVALASRTTLRADGVDLDVTALDLSPLRIANTVPHVVGDARALPFSDNSFDVVSSGLFAHHLSPEDFGRFIGESLRVARTAVLINDLVRDPVHLALVYAGTPLYRSRLTRNDAPASVRQAYTPDEMREMLRLTVAVKVEISRHYLFRMGAIAWKKV